MRGVHNSNDDALRASTITPCDLRSSGLIANLVTSAADTRAMGIGRLADLQTALFESYIDLVESVQADSIRVDVDRTGEAITVRMVAIEPEWTGTPSFLVQRVLDTLADRVETGEGSIEFEFLA